MFFLSLWWIKAHNTWHTLAREPPLALSALRDAVAEHLNVGPNLQVWIIISRPRQRARAVQCQRAYCGSPLQRWAAALGRQLAQQLDGIRAGAPPWRCSTVVSNATDTCQRYMPGCL
jgi:hypothetical protein